MWTLLRPDYHDFFPEFSSREVAQRMSHSPIHLATLLSPRHLLMAADVTGQDELGSFAALPMDRQRRLLYEVLRFSGIPERACEAVGRVARERFIPSASIKQAYLNTSVPICRGSCLSPPGLVALMLAQLPQVESPRILEVGIGSGYHAACALEFFGCGSSLIGVEARPAVASYGALNLSAIGANAQVLDPGTLHQNGHIPPFDVVYFTHALSENISAHRALVDRVGVLQGPRKLLSNEFESERHDSGLRHSYSSFGSYLSGRWRDYLCMETLAVEGDVLSVIGRLYAVTFVSQLQ